MNDLLFDNFEKKKRGRIEEEKLNNRPRKILESKTPAEVFFNINSVLSQNIALTYLNLGKQSESNPL